MPSSATVLELSGIDLGDYGARGLTATLKPIQSAGNLVRVASGALRDFSNSLFRKYAVTVSCNDLDSPELVGIWPGQSVTATLLPQMGSHAVDTAGEPEVLILSMLVISWNIERDEWGAQTKWSIELEEV